MSARKANPCNRRQFLVIGAAGAATLLVASGCDSDKSTDGLPGKDGVVVKHVFGETTVPVAPTRVVSAGFTEQDDLLAVGVVPIATTDWFGEQPFAVWPWAQSALGDAKPQVLSLSNGIQVDKIAALKPDLIVAINAGCDEETYKKLSAIAPTIAQQGEAPFFEPWKDQAKAIGDATFQHDKMTALIQAVDDKFTAVAQANPAFKDKKVMLLQGTTYWQNSVIATRPGHKTEFLSQMGFNVPDNFDSFTREHDNRAYLPLDKIGPVLDTADVLIWTTESPEDQAKLLADPNIAKLKATRENRNVFTDKELAGAIAFSSVSSYPVVAERLPPLLAKLLG